MCHKKSHVIRIIGLTRLTEQLKIIYEFVQLTHMLLNDLACNTCDIFFTPPSHSKQNHGSKTASILAIHSQLFSASNCNSLCKEGPVKRMVSSTFFKLQQWIAETPNLQNITASIHTQTININMIMEFYNIPSAGARILHDKWLHQHSSQAHSEYEKWLEIES